MWTYIVAAVWLACGVAHYGFWLAFFQREWPLIAQENAIFDRLLGVITALAGPVGLFADMVVFSAEGRPFRHGWML